MRIAVEKEKCTGCGLCENICSLGHLGVVDRSRSAVRIRLDDLGDSVHTPFVCAQCKKMKCLEKELLLNAGLDADKERRKFVWNEKARVDCCPFNACFEHKGKVYHCDLCGGDPHCVKLCTQGALTVESRGKGSGDKGPADAEVEKK